MITLLRHFLRLGVIIGALPNTISNGQALDAVPVMADFNWIVAQVNSNAAAASDLAATNANVSAIQGKFDISNTYTPAWTSSSGTAPVIGNGSQLGEYTRNGNTVHCKVSMLFNTTTTFGSAGIWSFGLPLPYAGTLESNGTAYYNVGGGSDVISFVKILLSSPSTFTVRNPTNAIGFATGAWASGGYVICTFTYQIAN